MDHHVPGPIVRGLRVRGIDVLTAFEARMHRIPDEEPLARATELGRVLVTQDEVPRGAKPGWFFLAKFFPEHNRGVFFWRIFSRSKTGAFFSGEVFRGAKPGWFFTARCFQLELSLPCPGLTEEHLGGLVVQVQGMPSSRRLDLWSDRPSTTINPLVCSHPTLDRRTPALPSANSSPISQCVRDLAVFP